MKRIKKFLGVFLALAMVVSMVGMMPAVEAKAEATVTATITAPDAINTTIESLIVGFDTNMTTSGPASTVGGVVSEILIGETPIVLATSDSVTWTGTDKVEIPIPTTPIVKGQVINITFATGLVVATAPYQDTVKPATTIVIDSSEEEQGENTPPATGEISAYSFNPKTNILTVSVTDADTTKNLNNKTAYIQVGEMKYGKTDLPKKYNTFEVKLTSANENNIGTVDFDLTAYAKKDIQLHIRTGESDTGQFVSIAKSKIKLKVVLDLDADDAYDRFTIKNGSNVLTPDEIGLLQYRVEGSSWVDFKNTTEANQVLDAAISKIEQFGSTIYFRVLGPETEAATGYTFASPEAKAKYPKLGKAPGITLDYVKNIVKFAKEVKVIGILADPLATTPAGSVAGDWTPFVPTATKAESVSLDKLVPESEVDGSFTFYVQTAAKDKKPKSAVTMVEVKEKESKDTITEQTVVVEKVNKSATDKTVKGITIENKTGKVIEYLITGDATPAPEARWTKIANTNKKSVSGTTESLNGKNLFVRYPGVKENTKNDISAQRTSNFETFVIDATKEVEAPVVPGSLTFDGELADATGVNTDGKAILSYTTEVTESHKFVYKVFATSAEVEAIKLDDVATGWTDVPSSDEAIELGTNAADTNNKILVVAEVLKDGSKIKKIKSITISGVVDGE